ncbi:MAG: HD domain-containing protein [Thermoguttaceae bacterium]|jgi:GTP pyrophosphokinase
MRLTERFNDALQYAVQLHAGQMRKVSGEPYAAHLLGVASIVLDYGADEDEAIAALLHDAIEDQGSHWQSQWHSALGEEIGRRFGPGVAAIVRGCSDAETMPKPPWQERKEAFLARLEHASPSIRLIVAADKLHNVRSLLRDYRRQGETIWRHFKGGREKTLWYYRAVVEVLKRSGVTPLVEELDRAVTELERLAAGGDFAPPKTGNIE